MRIVKTKGYNINAQDMEEGKKDIKNLKMISDIQKFGSDQ